NLAGEVVEGGDGAAAVGGDRHAVHEDVGDAVRLVGHEAVAAAGEGAHASDRTGVPRGPVDHAHSGRGARHEPAAVGEAEQVGELAGQAAHPGLHRHEVATAHPAAEEVRGQRRVTDLAHVRAGVGEAQHAALGGEQGRHAV